MKSKHAFNSKVAARTLVAATILNDVDLLKAYIASGGRQTDLEKIRQHGENAEVLNHAQGSSRSDGKLATREVLRAFEALRTEYSSLLVVLRAIQQELTEEKRDLLARRVQDILRNQSETGASVYAAEDGKKARKVRKKLTQEAIRAEINRDAGDLLKLTELEPWLSQRQWSAARLKALQSAAGGLAGKVGDRYAKKGAAKEATQAERTAVAAQSATWRSVYGLLSALARQNANVTMMLRDARA